MTPEKDCTIIMNDERDDQDGTGMDERRLARFLQCKQRYQKQRKVGEGTYAVVYQGIDLARNSCPIAIKKIKMATLDGQGGGGLDISAVRELKLLRRLLRHENVVELVDVFASASNLQLVLAFYPFDLERIIKDKQRPFSVGDIKSWMSMILNGVAHIHSRFILHRDLKPSNLLVGEDGVVRLADFGLARMMALSYEPMVSGCMTSQVVTRWYRAPELLFGAKQYDGGVDVWAVGCIFAELLLRTAFLPGDSDISQLQLMSRALGTPTDQDWPEMSTLPDYFHLPKHPKQPLQSIFTAASPEAIDLLGKMLTWNPNKRITAADALNHPFFTQGPPPTMPSLLPKPTATVKPTMAGEPRRLFT